MTVMMIANGALSALLALFYLLFGAAQDQPGPGASAAKTASVALLALIALAVGAPLPVTLGLAFGALGDFFLTRRGESAFLAGMAAFATGHLLYVLWMFTPENAARAVWALPVIALALSAEYWLLPRTGALVWPVRAYIWIIAAMAAAAATLPDVHRLAILGAALFLISDLLLSLRLFVTTDPTRQRLLSLLLWPAYWGGQALILLGSLGHP